MVKLLVVITSEERAEIGDTALPNDRLWMTSGWKNVGDNHAVWVINGLRTGLPSAGRKWKDGFSEVARQRSDAVCDSVGVIYHRSARFDDDETIPLNALSEAFPIAGNRHNNYSHGNEQSKWEQQQQMAAAIEANPQSPIAIELFDRFWLTCFGDPILEDLILLLKIHALKKSVGTEIDNLGTLTAAIPRNVDGQQNNNGRVVSDEAVRLVTTQLKGASGYDALRTALVKAVVARKGDSKA